MFAKKSKTSNVSGEVVTAEVYSFTHNVMNQIIVPKEYIEEFDRILIADDNLDFISALVTYFQDQNDIEIIAT